MLITLCTTFPGRPVMRKDGAVIVRNYVAEPRARPRSGSGPGDHSLPMRSCGEHGCDAPELRSPRLLHVAGQVSIQHDPDKKWAVDLLDLLWTSESGISISTRKFCCLSMKTGSANRNVASGDGSPWLIVLFVNE